MWFPLVLCGGVLICGWGGGETAAIHVTNTLYDTCLSGGCWVIKRCLLILTPPLLSLSPPLILPPLRPLYISYSLICPCIHSHFFIFLFHVLSLFSPFSNPSFCSAFVCLPSTNQPPSLHYSSGFIYLVPVKRGLVFFILLKVMYLTCSHGEGLIFLGIFVTYIKV